MIDIPDVVAHKARVHGAQDWLDGLEDLVATLVRRWGLALREPLPGGTEAYVTRVIRPGGTGAVLKLLVPGPGRSAASEIEFLSRAGGHGCAALYEHDVAAGALLVEELGPTMHELGWSHARRLRALCDTARVVWQPASDASFPTGAAKARWLIDAVMQRWEELDRPCSEAAVAHAVAAAEAREAAHRDERARLVHGDVHEWNALVAGDGFKLVDPDGMRAEPEADLGILMREDPLEDQEDPTVRARALAARTGLDATAIWEWGVVERVSTGLVATEIDLQPVGRQMLALADRLAIEHLEARL